MRTAVREGLWPWPDSPDNRDRHCLVLYQEAQFPAWTSSVTVAFTHSSIKHLKPLEAGSTGRGPECCPQTHSSLQSYFQRC